MSITTFTTLHSPAGTAGGRIFRFHSTILCSRQLLTIPAEKINLSFRINPGVNYKRAVAVVVYGGGSPPAPPSDPSPSSWKIWILGFVMTFITSSWTSKWGPFQKLKKQVETALSTAERVAEIVEKVAEDVEKIAEDISDELPEKGKLKDSVMFLENLAKVTAKDAQLAEEIIDKVEEVEKKVDIFIDQVKDINNKVDDLAN